MEKTVTDKLLDDTKKVKKREQEEVKEIEIDRKVMMTEEEEQGGRIEETSFLQVKDHSDPLEVDPRKTLKIRP